MFIKTETTISQSFQTFCIKVDAYQVNESCFQESFILLVKQEVGDGIGIYLYFEPSTLILFLVSSFTTSDGNTLMTVKDIQDCFEYKYFSSKYNIRYIKFSLKIQTKYYFSVFKKCRYCRL